ncbi:AFG1-like ATPase-domain-containing protein [Limtongia smithiae]|uniref:AFG1-like ATPase-domain-containing protein n=1 Tax=Limtongia smithiae TaxID=1125753 RepID=UPI0034CFFA1D
MVSICALCWRLGKPSKTTLLWRPGYELRGPLRSDLRCILVAASERPGRSSQLVIRRNYAAASAIGEIVDGGLTITDPLVLYRHYVESERLRPDEAQHRAAIEFQKLYYRVKDYTPPQDFQRQIEKLAELLERSDEQSSRIPFFSPERQTVALIRTLTTEEEIFNIKSPQGLMVHGEVGSGKSMLMDLFAASLPHASKKRWHYHNFMLSIYARIHRQSQRNQSRKFESETRINMQNEFVLLKIAHELIEESNILMLDEFMLPDIAAAKIVKTLFTYYFKMGGVLVATSNRLPKELYSAEYKKSQFRSFYDILQARCASHDMRSSNDWRNILCAEAQEALSEGDKQIQRYWVAGVDSDEDWNATVNAVCGTENFREEGETAELTVYGRTLHIPWQKDRIAFFDFAVLCDAPLAGADYITLASRYHTLILDNVPELRVINKNQARRLITLLDALYECRVRLVIRAASNVDDLFFPDMKVGNIRAADVVTSEGVAEKGQDDSNDSLELEMYSEVEQDLTSPYRPNVSSYSETEKTFSAFVDDAGEGIKAEGKDFTRSAAFTGEDERFAYRRAISRLKEMTGSEAWWSTDNWLPLDDSLRTWETAKSTLTPAPPDDSLTRLSRHGGHTEASGYRKELEPPPKFSVAHIWSMVNWGPGKKRDSETRRWMRGSDAYDKDS